MAVVLRLSGWQRSANNRAPMSSKEVHAECAPELFNRTLRSSDCIRA